MGSVLAPISEQGYVCYRDQSQTPSLFISEERDDGVLIRPAEAVPADLAEVRRKIRVGLDQLDRGEGIPGEEVEAELKRASKAFRAMKK